MIFELPNIDLDEETSHVSKDLVDSAFDLLVENHPEVLGRMSRDDRGGSNGVVIDDYARGTQCIIRSGRFSLPDEIFCVELTFELVRRCRVALGYEPPIVLGKPLPPSIDGSYPQLTSKEICESTKMAGFDQSTVDAWVDEYYEKHHAVCFIKAEAFRREVASTYLAERIPGYEFFYQKVLAMDDENLLRHYTKPLRELADRIRMTCGIK